MATKIIVEGISAKTSESELKTLFSQHGDVEEVSIHTTKDGERARRYALLEMTNSEEAQKAITSLHSKDFNERKLTVNQAAPRRR